MRTRWRAVWHPLLQGGACALVGATDRRGAGRELVGDFGNREPPDVAHQQDRALPRRWPAAEGSLPLARATKTRVAFAVLSPWNPARLGRVKGEHRHNRLDR